MVVLLPIHLLALGFTMIRWQHGQVRGAGLNPLAGPWHPVLGSITPLVAAVAGLAVIGWLAWIGGSRTPSVDVAGPDPDGSHAAPSSPDAVTA